MEECCDKNPERIYLVVIDNSQELKAALRYACRRAKATNSRIALLHVIENQDQFNHFMGVGDLINEEAREEAEELLERYAHEINDTTGNIPILYLREGNKINELIKLIKETPELSVLVLGIGGAGEPGPLIHSLTGKESGKINIPITIVPGTLSEQQIDDLA